MGVGAEKVYFDANVLIYLLQGSAEFAAALDVIRERVESGAWIAHTGEISICELLVKPFRDRKLEAVREARHFLLDSGAFTLIPTTAAVYELAAELRAVFNLKIGDAIHAASAIRAECAAFVSNDKSIRLPPEIRLQMLGGSIP